ncbi:MAG: DNA polymerase III subunit delta [Myxococcales bacterium]|nr:DNA polymerase III subunit delta [Myxococcales bacterium]
MATWPPASIIVSDQPLLVQRALVEVRALVPTSLAGFNVDVVEGKPTAARIIGLAQTMPMMSPLRVVLVRDITAMSADELAKLAPYFAAPVDTTVLVAVATKVDKRLKFWQTADKNKWIIELKAPRQLQPWLEAEAKAQGIALAPRTAARLIEIIGDDLARLAGVLQQLALYAGQGAVTPAHVEALVATTRESTVFELTDALGQRDLPAVLAALRALADQRESAIGVLAMVTRFARQVIKAQELLARGAPRGDFPGQLGVPPFAVDKLVDAAKRLRLPPTVMVELAATDAALKGGDVGDGFISAGQMKALGRQDGEEVALLRMARALMNAPAR